MRARRATVSSPGSRAGGGRVAFSCYSFVPYVSRVGLQCKLFPKLSPGNHICGSSAGGTAVHERVRGHARQRAVAWSLAPWMAPSNMLFAIVTSRATRQRALGAWRSWCASAGVACRFFADAPFGADKPPGLHWTVLKASAPRHGCCKQQHGFFCAEHRRHTLTAQYRFLPALRSVRQSEAFSRGRFPWIILLDDDSFVFARRLAGLLARYSAQEPLMLGEFKSDHSYACGGAGAVLSRAALSALNLDSCIARSGERCMQSDWQLGECVRRAGVRVRLVAQHGCGSCAVRNCTGRCTARLLQGCHFMQEAGPYASWLQRTSNCTAVRAPSIVHGTTPVTGAAGGRSHSLAATLARSGAARGRSQRAACLTAPFRGRSSAHRVTHQPP